MLVIQQAFWNYRHREHTRPLYFPIPSLKVLLLDFFFPLDLLCVHYADLSLHSMHSDRRKMIDTENEQCQLLLWN